MISTLHIFANTEAGEKTGIALLGIDPKALLLQAGTFVLLFVIVKKFALKKIVQTLEERRTTINSGVELGLDMKKQKAEFDEELKKLHHQARANADEIIAAASGEAADIIKAGEASATTKIDQMLKDAEARIEREMAQARKDLEKDMLGLVAQATEVIIGEKLDDKKDASLIGRALNRIKA